MLVVSDFLVADGWQAAWGQLAQRHDLVAVQLCDPRETELPDIGIITFEDPETGSQIIVDTGDAELRERYKAAVHEQAARLRAAITRCGADQLVLRTDDPLLPALIRFLSARRHRSRTLGRARQARR